MIEIDFCKIEKNIYFNFPIANIRFLLSQFLKVRTNERTTRKLRRVTTKIPQSYYNNRRDGDYYANEVPLNTKYFQVGDDLPERAPRPTRPITTTQTSTQKSWFQPTVQTTKTSTSSSTSTATTQLPSQTRPKIPILVKKLAKRPLSKVSSLFSFQMKD